MSTIHSTAIVDPKAELDSSVEVGPYSIIDAGVQIGANTRIGPHVVLRGPMTIGRDNRIFQFCSLGEISQDKTAKYDDATRVEIGNGNTIREYVTIQRGTLKQSGLTSVGDNNWIMAMVHIAHDCHVHNNTVLANGVTLAGHVTIEDFAGLGGYTLVHQFCRIGAHVYTGGGTLIRKDVPPFVMAEGAEGRARGLNSEGLKRRGFSAEDIAAIKDAYKLIYLSGEEMATVKRKLAQMAQTSAAVAQMHHFIENSKRAIQR
ncbi:acyl-ACP--UDP-N-acetylglucosamine O-acyltransferase [Sinimarinibacterium sp. NLF-5-8]|uniref:acyl-ACP--UDP-N-acetylglucosamine O-acyltransferase n=1 Tax=Sinimarinibacterium sp. NLF-5-8 TaxID=2698684 RepID=UPI00137C19FC|nr:acyl-ACP--UDP-N-acetylglucosamine O-acyltransferase [Sinimarinibacterium sp. NLF-5-8]QHS08971.1 acyl-ACP--UDP-N-acetylglucosamine O-acyltransferase [Sinimarinibacterium sp. NLF-5-8]